MRFTALFAPIVLAAAVFAETTVCGFDATATNPGLGGILDIISQLTGILGLLNSLPLIGTLLPGLNLGGLLGTLNAMKVPNNLCELSGGIAVNGACSCSA
ncbi:hypothetical protein EYR40_008476 [Pleurotus pulmonarius]|nr:hypothetical protein EYR36_009294 [Pleurotus pulmonarius]KAF4592793.1 hypothetical protein EYR38_008495 [Pleurotus pulmonarius]KAF4593686.1 hypothetical protein EYR40_008476 [Pleurotus pulmonarius]